MDAKARKLFLILVERWKVVVGGCIAIAVPTVTAYTSYRENLNNIKIEFVQVRAENEAKYAKKDEMSEVLLELKTLNNNVSEMRGELRADRRDRRRRDGY